MAFSRKFLILACFLLIGLPHTNVVAKEEKPTRLVFSLIAGNESQIEIAELLKRAYKKLGISAEFVDLPARRALEYSDSGKTDGEVFRIKTINKKFTNLRRVPTPVMSFYGMAYSTKNLNIKAWKDLKPYRVGILRGVVWSERGTKGFKVAQYNSNKSLYEKLLTGGVDVIVSTSYSFDKEIKRRGHALLIHKGDPLMQFNVFHFVNKKHMSLIDKVDAEIKKLVGVSDTAKYARPRTDTD